MHDFAINRNFKLRLLLGDPLLRGWVALKYAYTRREHLPTVSSRNHLLEPSVRKRRM